MNPADQIQNMFVEQNSHLEELDRFIDQIAIADGVAPGIEELENARIKLIEYQLWLARARTFIGG